NSGGTTDVVVDVMGWFATTSGTPGSRFHGTVPSRVLDTRTGLGAGGPVGPGQTVRLGVTGKGGVPSSRGTAVGMNVTVTSPTGSGYVTVYPDDAPRPLASNLNFVPDQTVPKLVVVRVPANGVVDLFNSSGATHLIADVVGWFDNDRSTNAGRFVAVSPVRLLDTRDTNSPIGPQGALRLALPGPRALPSWGIGAVVANATVTAPTTPSYVTVYPADAPTPLASNLNFLAGQTFPNLVAVKTAADGRIAFYNLSG